MYPTGNCNIKAVKLVIYVEKIYLNFVTLEAVLNGIKLISAPVNLVVGRIIFKNLITW